MKMKIVFEKTFMKDGAMYIKDLTLTGVSAHLIGGLAIIGGITVIRGSVILSKKLIRNVKSDIEEGVGEAISDHYDKVFNDWKRKRGI